MFFARSFSHLGEGAAKAAGEGGEIGPHPALRATFSRREKDSPTSWPPYLGDRPLQLHRTDAVILAIADVKSATVDEDAVWPREFASERIAVRAVAALAGADDGGNHSISQIDPSNDVVFRVGDIESAFGGICDALRSIKFCGQCGAAVARVSHFTCSGKQLELASSDIDFEHSVAFTQDQIHFAVRRDIDGARSC